MILSFDLFLILLLYFDLDFVSWFLYDRDLWSSLAANAREVTAQEGQAVAKAWKCAFMETSAKTDHNVNELFQELLQLERRRTMTLNLESKKSRSQKRREMLQGKCVVM